MKKRGMAAALALWILCGMTANAQPNESGTSAKAAVVMDQATGRVLFDYQGSQRLAQASTTKIMTTLLALEETELDTYFTVDSDAIHVEGSSMGLQEGDQVSLRQLCYGMILPSGNDAANVTAVRLAGSIPAFAELMNERAFQLGLEDTAFVTPSGLDAEGHYTTAIELAELTRYAMENETFREICCQSSAKTHFGNPPYDRWLNNHNKLLEFYEPCIGVKTGFTEAAGRVLVSSAQKDGMELICVTMNDPDDWRDHENLYERFFGELKATDIAPLLPEAEVPVAGGEQSVPVAAVGNTVIPLREEEYGRLQVRLALPPFEYAPVQAGSYAGEAQFWLDAEKIYALPLCYTETSAAVHPYQEKQSLWKKLREWISR